MYSHPIPSVVAHAVIRATHQPSPQLDALLLFGFMAAFFALACYPYRHHSRSMMLALAVFLAATAAYGFLQGAWPLGIIQAAWSAATFRNAFKTRRIRTPNRHQRPGAMQVSSERLTRMFGPI